MSGDEDNGRSWNLLALVAVPVVITVSLPIILMLGTSSGALGSSALSGSTGPALDPSKVPPAFLPYVTAAGSKCLQISSVAIAAQLEAESEWNPAAVSPVGAQGIAQFMPGTWSTWGKDVDGNGEASPFDPADAIDAQGEFMCSLARSVATDLELKVVQGDPLDLALAAYNAGLGAVEQNHGVPPFIETQTYVAKIRELMAAYSAATGGVPLPGGVNAVVDAAAKWLGYPYVWGGGGLSGPTGVGRDGRGPGFDCSGLVRNAVYNGYGITLGRTADDEIWDARGTVVPRDWAQMQAGDLIGFSENGTGARGSFGHIGIYLGGGKMLHAPQTGQNVEIIDMLHETYWSAMSWRIIRLRP